MLRASVVEYPVAQLTTDLVTKTPTPPPPPPQKRTFTRSNALGPGMRIRTLRGLGDAGDALDKEIDGFLLKAPKPGSSEVVSFLQLYTGDARIDAAHRLIARGVSSTAVASALTWLDTSGNITKAQITGTLTLVSAAASAYHGYRRNGSLVWGAIWFACGMIFPIFTPAIALAQGYGKEKK